jgi:peptidoglycan/LPS O-acetylase OafA/YrhL
MQAKSSPYLTTLTPLRGIAALLVALFHCNIFYWQFLPPVHTQFLDLSWLWVDFFFILSGFIMSYAYGRNFRDGVRKKDFKKYIGARFARVYPLHFITTCWAFVCAILILPHAVSPDAVFVSLFDRKAIFSCLLLIQSLHLGYFSAPLNNPSWSLSTEWWAYMIFPFLVPYFSRLKTKGKWLAALLIIGFYFVLKFVEHDARFGNGQPPNMITDFGFFRCLAGFLAGMLLFTLFEHRAAFNIMRRDWFFALSFLGVIVGMHLGIKHLLIIAFFPLVLISAAYNDGLVKRILDTRPFQRLGDWSFSVYLVHLPIIYTFYIFDVRKDPTIFMNLGPATHYPTDYAHGLLMCGIIMTITILVSAFTYNFVEIPARNYFNGIFKTKAPKITKESYKV